MRDFKLKAYASTIAVLVLIAKILCLYLLLGFIELIINKFGVSFFTNSFNTASLFESAFIVFMIEAFEYHYKTIRKGRLNGEKENYHRKRFKRL